MLKKHINYMLKKKFWTFFLHILENYSNFALFSKTREQSIT